MGGGGGALHGKLDLNLTCLIRNACRELHKHKSGGVTSDCPHPPPYRATMHVLLPKVTAACGAIRLFSFVEAGLVLLVASVQLQSFLDRTSINRSPPTVGRLSRSIPA